MNEQKTHWLSLDYTLPPTVAPEVRSHSKLFESYMREADTGKISREEAIGRIRQFDQAGERLGQVAIISIPELSDSDRRAKYNY